MSVTSQTTAIIMKGIRYIFFIPSDDDIFLILEIPNSSRAFKIIVGIFRYGHRRFCYSFLLNSNVTAIFVSL